MAPRPIPEGYHTATPYLIVKGAAEAIEFYKKAFGARETMRFAAPDGKIGHAEMRIGDSAIMLADEHPDMGYRSPRSIGGTPVSILTVRGGRRPLVRACDRGRREGHEAGRQSVLR